MVRIEFNTLESVQRVNNNFLYITLSVIIIKFNAYVYASMRVTARYLVQPTVSWFSVLDIQP